LQLPIIFDYFRKIFGHDGAMKTLVVETIVPPLSNDQIQTI
jgi:hypothetical protein